MTTVMRRMIAPLPPLLPLPSQAATKGSHASSTTAASAQAVAAVAAAWCSGLRQGAVAAASRMPSLTPAFCVVLVRKLTVCYTWHRNGPSLWNSGRNSRFRRIPEKIILPWNDLILMCVPRNLKLSAETRGFRKIRPGRNRNKQRNTQPRLPAIDWLPRHIESILKRALNCSFLPQLVANKGRGHGHGPLPPPQKKPN